MRPADFPDSFIIEPQSTHKLTVILLHGRGDTGAEFAEDFFSTASSIAVPGGGGAGEKSLAHHFPSVRWVFPSAKRRLSSVFQTKLSEWYDVASLRDPEQRLDLQRAGLAESIQHVTEIVESEWQRLQGTISSSSSSEGKRRRLVLGGISMGCAVGIHVMLSSMVNLDDDNHEDDDDDDDADGESSPYISGFFGWCGWLPFGCAFRDRIEVCMNDNNKKNTIAECIASFYHDDIGISRHQAPNNNDKNNNSNNGGVVMIRRKYSRAPPPIFLSHCGDDEVIEPELGRELKEFVKALGMPVEWREYPKGGHWIKEPEAMDEFVKFLESLTEQRSSET